MQVSSLASPTGTPHFMALALLDRHHKCLHDFQCDLESLMYLFLFWSTKGTLPWWKVVDAYDRKWTVMSQPRIFQAEVLCEISNPALRTCAKDLRNLFFDGDYNQARLEVTCESFKSVLRRCYE